MVNNDHMLNKNARNVNAGNANGKKWKSIILQRTTRINDYPCTQSLITTINSVER